LYILEKRNKKEKRRMDFRLYDWDEGVESVADMLLDLWVGHKDVAPSKSTMEFSEDKENNIYFLNMALPGVALEDVDLSYKQVEQGYPFLSVNVKKATVFQKESKHEYLIPKDVALDKISASMKDGILKVTLPKKEKATVQDTIKINVE
jgi:HSP20 family molecular chaperone IbpA